jgi:hypothetical protein
MGRLEEMSTTPPILALGVCNLHFRAERLTHMYGISDTCTSCNIPLVSYCCAAEGVKRADITTNCAQEAPFFEFVNIPQINVIANYAHLFVGIDIDSIR